MFVRAMTWVVGVFGLAIVLGAALPACTLPGGSGWDCKVSSDCRAGYQCRSFTSSKYHYDSKKCAEPGEEMVSSNGWFDLIAVPLFGTALLIGVVSVNVKRYRSHRERKARLRANPPGTTS